jgi:hypothetical protein
VALESPAKISPIDGSKNCFAGPVCCHASTYYVCTTYCTANLRPHTALGVLFSALDCATMGDGTLAPQQDGKTQASRQGELSGRTD